MKPCDRCDREQLHQLYNETLAEVVANDLAEHLAECPTCQAELESFAAEQSWWQEASRRLSKSSVECPALAIGNHPRNVPSSARPLSDWTADDQSSRFRERAVDGSIDRGDSSDDGYASDFAVDFLEPSDNSSALGRLGDYEIVEVIGRGGMGIVLKGFQKELHRFVAVKVLAPHLATSGAARRRFAREAQATAAVVNPHVMAIHSVHANSKLPYLVMPFVECESLQQRLDHSGPLDLKDVLRIGMQAALGLGAAHAQGLVHRDVKPANILLETNVDRVMLTDFGLARAVDDATLTRTGIIAGTPLYMSPEQANGDAVDHRSDLFSLGSVLYAMCTARPPFRAETTFGVLRRIRETDPRPIREINSDIPFWFEQIVVNLLEKEPAHRMSTAIDVARLLEECLAHVQQPTVVPLPDALARLAIPIEAETAKVAKRFPWKWIGAAVVAGTLMGVAALWIGSRSASDVEQRTTNQSQVAAVKPPAEPIGDPSITTETFDPMFEWNQSQSELNSANRLLKQMEKNVRADLESDLPGESVLPGEVEENRVREH